MKSLTLCIAAAGALMFCTTSAYAATVHLQTTSTNGVFQNGGPDPQVSDTSASFSFDVSYTTPSDLTLYNGVFSDGNPNPFGLPEVAYDLAATGVNYFGGTGTLLNNDGAFLKVTLDFSSTNLPTLSGTYSFGGALGDTASGSFTATISTVPLPASAPLLGMALVALGAIGYGARRTKEAAGA